MLKKLLAVLTSLCAVALSLPFASCGTSSSRPAATILVGSQGDNVLLAYRSDLNSGKLTQVNTSVSTTDRPMAVIFDSTGGFAYVATYSGIGNGKVTAYSVGSDGTLGAGGSSADTGAEPVAMALDAAGHLFVANRASNTISSFSVNGGTITKVGDFSNMVPALAPSSLTIEPSGRFLYVANQGDDNVSVYSIAGGGQLTELTNQTNRYAAGDAPAASSIATTATGSYLYVANSGSNNVSAYVVCLTTIAPCTTADGSLIAVASSPFGASLNPVGIVVDPSNTFVYALNQDSNLITGYRINAATGGITTLSPANVSTGTRPVSIAFSPDGAFLYVVNSGGDTLGGYAWLAVNGALSPVTPVATSSLPIGLAVR